MLFSDSNLQVQNKYNLTNLYIVCKKCHRINDPIDRTTTITNNNLGYSDNVNTNDKRSKDGTNFENVNGSNIFSGQKRDICRCSNGQLGKVVKIKNHDQQRFAQLVDKDSI